MRDSEPRPFLNRLRRRRTAPPAAVGIVADPVCKPLAGEVADPISAPLGANMAPASDSPRAVSRRVLLVADDRRFRALASTLLSQRGYTVSVGLRGVDVAELAVREAADVVVIDASASLTAAAHEALRLGSLTPPVGIVAVSADSCAGLTTLPVVPKWSPFEALFGAIERACADVARDEVTSGTL
jgi:CheY-like chemotaxis protein